MNFSVGQSFTLEIFSSLQDEAVASRWDRLLPLDSELRSSQLLAIENSCPLGVRFHYALVKNESSMESADLIGLLYFQELTVSASQVKLNDHPLLGLFLSGCLSLKSFKLLLLGSVFSVGRPTYYFTDQQLANRFFEKIIQFVSENIRPTVLVLKDLRDSERKLIASNNRYNSFDADSTMILKLNRDWLSFDDYISVHRKKYRHRLMAILTAGDSIVRKELSLPELVIHAQRIRELYLSVADKQPIRLGIVDDRYFLEMKIRLGERFHVKGYFKENKLVAFASYLTHGHELEVHYIGMDYDYNEHYKLYFNILYDAVRSGIEGRFEQVELGRTSREAKSSIGAVPLTSIDYYRAEGSITQMLLRRLQKYFSLSQRPIHEKRRPFKM